MPMFESFDAVVLARAQFAFTMSFHIVFPAFSIGLASYLAVLEALWLWSGREVFINLFNYWLKIFAVAFGMGVVSGIVMSYQFGTNWSAFSDKTGPVIGPLMAYEVLTAFFLEAGFLGVMLFGLERVGHCLHVIATLVVAGGPGCAVSASGGRPARPHLVVDSPGQNHQHGRQCLLRLRPSAAGTVQPLQPGRRQGQLCCPATQPLLAGAGAFDGRRTRRH